MKIATLVFRILFGLFYAFSGLSYFLKLNEMPPMEGNAKIFMEGLMASGYLLTLAKITELVCGLAILVGLFAPLATVIIFPVTLNIFFIQLFTMHSTPGIVTGLIMLAVNLFLAYAYREKYKPMLSMK